jgi:DNA-binding FrmR family transcriptional regulator
MHTAKQRQKLLARARRLRGQIEAIERALETDADCGSVLHLIAGARGAMAGLMAEVVEDHVHGGASRFVTRTALIRTNHEQTIGRRS